MKKILFVAFSVALLATSCQKTEILSPVGDNVMSFSTSMSKITKSVGTADAAETGIKNLEAQDFSVWAFADKNCDFTSNGTAVDAQTGIYDMMANLHIMCSAASILDNPTTDANEAQAGTWLPANNKEYYWPGQNKNLKFFAVSADGNWLRATSCPVDIDLNDGDDENKLPTMTISNFKVENRPVMDTEDPTKVKKTAANEDLMVADYVKQNQSKKDVELNFRHTLSKVEFLFKTVKTAGVAVYVQKVEVEDLETTGTLNVSFASNTGIASFDWGELPLANSETLEKFTDDWETSVITKVEEKVNEDDEIDLEFPTKIEGQLPTSDDKKAMKLTAEGGVDDPAQLFSTWLMIPQSVEGKKVKITYLINERRFTSIFALDANLTDAKWAENQYIRYTVTLAPNIIKFVPEVEGWDQFDAVSGNKDNNGKDIMDDITMQN